MIIGAWNEDAVLVAFSNLPFVKKVFSCGLFKSHRFPWLAASPDAIAVLASNDSRLVCSVIEVKTRTTENTIVEAEGIAAKHNGKYILANIEDDIWNDAVPWDHSNQVLLQLAVTGWVFSTYISSWPGATQGKGRIIYIVFGTLDPSLVREKTESLIHRTQVLLSNFFNSNTWDKVSAKLPTDISTYDSKFVELGGLSSSHSVRKPLVVVTLEFYLVPCPRLVTNAYTITSRVG